MLDLGYIKQMLDRYDAFDVTSKSIRSESTLSETHSSKLCQFVVRNLDDVDVCGGERVNSH